MKRSFPSSGMEALFVEDYNRWTIGRVDNSLKLLDCSATIFLLSAAMAGITTNKIIDGSGMINATSSGSPPANIFVWVIDPLNAEGIF